MWLALILASAPLDSLFYSLDPESISESLAFYQLYSDSSQGEAALERAWTLVQKHRGGEETLNRAFALPEIDIMGLVSLVNQEPHEEKATLSEDELKLIHRLSSHLGNRKLKGNQVWNALELPALTSDEIDLARALLLYQYETKDEILEYEATLDLMALQILARLPRGASHEQKVAAINNFIFYEKGFRFPPHSIHVENIDLYTFLPSVLDSRKGVCLGVSILYLSLAQRLDLPLEIITPPPRSRASSFPKFLEKDR